jgi:hypothetical protein
VEAKLLGDLALATFEVAVIEAAEAWGELYDLR